MTMRFPAGSGGTRRFASEAERIHAKAASAMATASSPRSSSTAQDAVWPTAWTSEPEASSTAEVGPDTVAGAYAAAWMR